MRNYAIIRRFSTIFLLQSLVAAGLAQPSNTPSSQTLVGAAAHVAATPAGYIVNGQSPLVNFVRERDGMGRISDSSQFAAAGYADVQETMHYFDGIGRPLQIVQRQITPGSSPSDL